jgi:hypothetical protein
MNEAIAAGNFASSHIAKLTPFIEQMGRMDRKPKPYRKEFWWEREWRRAGDFVLPERFIGICPANEIPELEKVVKSAGHESVWIDSAWGLEEIIGRLAGFAANEISVFD